MLSAEHTTPAVVVDDVMSINYCGRVEVADQADNVNLIPHYSSPVLSDGRRTSLREE